MSSPSAPPTSAATARRIAQANNLRRTREEINEIVLKGEFHANFGGHTMSPETIRILIAEGYKVLSVRHISWEEA